MNNADAGPRSLALVMLLSALIGGIACCQAANKIALQSIKESEIPRSLEPTGAITAIIKGSNSHPRSEVILRLLSVVNGEEKLFMFNMTNIDGIASFQNIPVGTYRIDIHKTCTSTCGHPAAESLSLTQEVKVASGKSTILTVLFDCEPYNHHQI